MNAAITDMQMRQRDVAALDAKYTKELADAKVENDAWRDDAAGRRRLWSKQFVSQCVKPLRSGVMANAARLADTAYPDYFTLREADHYAKKQPEGTQKYINASVDRVAHIDGQLMQLVVSITHSFPSGV